MKLFRKKTDLYRLLENLHKQYCLKGKTLNVVLLRDNTNDLQIFNSISLKNFGVCIESGSGLSLSLSFGKHNHPSFQRFKESRLVKLFIELDIEGYNSNYYYYCCKNNIQLAHDLINEIMSVVHNYNSDTKYDFVMYDC